MDPTPAEHWEHVYRTKPSHGVSWFRPHLELSLELLRGVGLDATSRVVDVGGGASSLADDLLAAGVAEISVIDLSAAALQVAQRRLGERAARIDWRVGDITALALPAAHYSHWHDRAVLHFLTEPAAAEAYAAQAAHALAPGGHAIIGGFAPDGPERCSGLVVARRSAQDVAALLGPAFTLIEERHERHHTPGGSEQAFAWAVLRRR
jgi:2-polyprenyl-3-methyl-5-hydroxy-6-metoxy-1,4-benzoquinol methylase